VSAQITVKLLHIVYIIVDCGVGRMASGPDPCNHDVRRARAGTLGDPGVLLSIEIGADDICRPCIHNVSRACEDSLDADLANQKDRRLHPRAHRDAERPRRRDIGAALGLTRAQASPIALCDAIICSGANPQAYQVTEESCRE
jgi:hypothetical protein